MRGRLLFNRGDGDFPYQSDIDRIVRVCAERGWEISPNDAHSAWGAYSDDMCAGWMSMGMDSDEDVYRTVRNRCAEVECST